MYKFKLADIGEGLHEAQITKIHVQEQDEVQEGQMLFTIETDKVVTELTAPVSGKMSKIYFKEFDTALVGDVLVDIDNG